MATTLVLIEVDGGLVSDVHYNTPVKYHVIDWDVADQGDELEELSEEFAAEWPELAQAVRDKNADLND